ncbi:MAG: hypothetical protein IPO07_23120 [Haliscomenobacter sp.]|nr:hypothetical protein [Haliscomenobacter sp.]MBK9491360.1 hypothetical protein [Haliscomenobacter sp.]
MRTNGIFEVGDNGERLLVDVSGNLKIKGDLLMQGFKKIQIGAFSIVDADGKIDIRYNNISIFRVDKDGNMSTRGSHNSGKNKMKLGNPVV